MWLQPLIEHEGLQCADCGYPIVNPETLEWAPNLFMIGALAELEIGPVSRNIAGARRGAERILERVSRALKPGGYFLMDYLNPSYLREHLTPFTRNQFNSMDILQFRSLTDEFVEKRIIIKEDGEQRQYMERVKLYNLDRLNDMLSRNHLEMINLFGNYDISPFIASTSPRMILICKKTFMN